jgi:hypothetical protein
MAIKSLSRILPQWVSWKNEHIKDFTLATYPMPDCTPRFIGELIQRFNIRRRVAAATYQPKINPIKRIIKDIFAPALTKHSMLFPQAKYDAAGVPNNFCLAEIKEFAALGQRYQDIGIPVFAIPDDRLDATGTVKEQLIRNRTEFDAQFTHVADTIITLLS